MKEIGPRGGDVCPYRPLGSANDRLKQLIAMFHRCPIFGFRPFLTGQFLTKCEKFEQLPRSSDTSPLFSPVKISTPMYRCIITMKHSTPPNVRQHASCTHCLVIIPKFSNFLAERNQSFLSKLDIP